MRSASTQRLEESTAGLSQYSNSQEEEEGKSAGAPGHGQHALTAVRSASTQRLEESTAGVKTQPVAVNPEDSNLAASVVVKARRIIESRRTDGTLSTTTQGLVDSVRTMTRQQVVDKLRWLGCPAEGRTSELRDNLKESPNTGQSDFQ